MVRRPTSGARGAGFLSLSLVLLTAAAAQAQHATPAPDEATTERARALFEEGLEHADAGDWERAVHRFRRALELREAAPVRFNLATSLARMGRILEAIEELDRILAGPDLDEAIREAAEAQRAELEPRLGELVVRVEGDAEDTLVTVDGRPWESIGVAAPADPGIRVVRLLRETEELDVTEADVPEGGVARVLLEVPLPVAATEAGVAVALEEDGGSDDAWIWGIVIGVLVVGAGAAAVTTAVLMDQGSGGAMGDFMPPVMEIGP